MQMKRLSWAFSVLLLLSAAGCNRPGSSATRSDAEVAAEVQQKINADSAVTNKAITVNSRNGVVTLAGTVANETERIAASNDAAAVNGVKQVVNNLTVGQPGDVAGGGATPPFPSNQNVGSAAPSRREGSSRPATSTRGSSAQATTSAAATPAAGSHLGGTSGGSNNATPQVTVPSGTTLVVYLNEGVSSETANTGDRFSGTLGEPLYVNDRVAVPKNAQVSGRVVRVKSAGKFKGQSELVLELTSLAYGGRSYRINSDQWSKAGSSRGKNTAMKVGSGAALGAIIGGIAGGGKGAAIGAGAGAAAGTGVQAITKGQQIELKPESMLQFTLEAPVNVAPSATEGTNRERLPSPGDGQ